MFDNARPTGLLEVTSSHSTKVMCYASAVLYEKGYYSGGNILAMSLIGPEQVMRAVAAACANPRVHERPVISFRGERRVVQGKWDGKWTAKSQVLSPGAMHMVAMPEWSKSDTMTSSHRHVIIPQAPTTGSLFDAVYDRLMTAYTTPLVPRMQHGGLEWRDVIVREIVRDSRRWRQLLTHPEQTDTAWSKCGVLTLTDLDLDRLTTGLVKNGTITVPERKAAC